MLPAEERPTADKSVHSLDSQDTHRRQHSVENRKGCDRYLLPKGSEKSLHNATAAIGRRERECERLLAHTRELVRIATTFKWANQR